MAACAAAATTCLSVWHSVPERASYGTEYACRAQKGLLGYATHFQRHSVYENPLFLHGRRFQRNSVLKTGSYGTEEIFGAKNSLLWYATHLQRPTEQPTPQTVDSLLWYAMRFQGPPVHENPLLPHRTHLQCAKQPPLSLFAPAPSTISFVPLTRNLSPADPSPAPSTALGTRNGPRSDVSRHKKRVTSKSIKTF